MTISKTRREPVTPREWVTISVIILAVVCLLQLPYLSGYLMVPADTEFTGLMVNVEDGSYLTAIEMGRQGEWQYQIRFTLEPHEPVYLYEFYLASGHLARLLGIDTPTMWHLIRGLMNGFMFFVVFGFVAYLLPTAAQRRVAFLLAILGSGFDWFLLPGEAIDYLSAAPLDIRQPEAHLFFSALTYAHYGAAVGLVTLLVWSWLRLMTETLSSLKQFWLGLLAAFANLALLVVHPFLVFMTPLVLGFFWVFLAARAKRILWHQAIILVLIYLPSLPFLLYYFQVLRTNPVIAAWNAQAVTLSPNPLHYLLAYAPYLALAGWGAVHLKGKLLDSPERILLWLWVLVVALLLYAPIGAQRRFVEGVQVPLAILATLGLYEVALPRLERAAWFQALAHRPNYSVAGLRRLLMVALVAILAVPNLYLYVGALSSLGIQQAYPLFRPRAETAAMDWLKASVPPDSLVLSAYVTGSYLPYRAGTLSYIGQRYETIGFETKQRLVEAFFSSQSDADRLAFLQQNSIDYIFYGRAERDLGSFDPSKAKFLKSVWRNDQVQIYNLEQP